ncbi:MAG: ATP-binding cassette domain-containing protein [Cyanobacteria bacterium P01_A01_bin.84]
MLNKPVVSIRNLRHTFDDTKFSEPVLKDINLDIFRGEIVILAGPSGSGKTTLLTLIGALRTVQHGIISVLNQDLHKSHTKKLAKIRRLIGFIFQTHNLMESLTALQNVAMSLRLHEDISLEKRVFMSKKILSAVDLEDYFDYYPKNLSVGQKQRVAIARALVTKPSLILADEPTASLDSYTGRAVTRVIQKLARVQDSTILLVTHDNRIFDIADRILYMEDGQLVQKN